MIIENIPCQPDRVSISRYNTLRIKVTEKCPFDCRFCHHEGSPRTDDLLINQELPRVLKKFYEEMKLTEVHLTGGEPTSYAKCLDLIGLLKSMGFKVKMTSNGQFDTLLLRKLRDQGLHGINFSIHTLNPLKLASMQKQQRSYKWGLKALERQLDNLVCCKELDIDAKINTVVQNDSDIMDIISFCKSEGIELRILDDLSPGSLSIQRIIEILTSMQATVEGINLIDKASSYSYNLLSEDGFEFKVKSIRKNVLRSLCMDCNERDSCTEWFYGIRIEQVGDEALARLCLHRDDYPAIQPLRIFFDSEQCRELSSGQ